MKTSPGAMVFNRDMMTNILLISKLIAIGKWRHQLVDENTRRVNARRMSNKKYNIGNMVKFINYNPNKLDNGTHGSYWIVRVFTNRTVRIQLSQHVQEIVNTRKIFPYHQ